MRILSGIFILISFSGLAKEIEVCPKCEVSSIKRAIALADSGDHIIIGPGVYKEGNIPVDKPLKISGKNRPIIDGEYQTEIFTINADSVTISGLQVQNVGVSYIEDRAAIKILNGDYCLIEDNWVLDALFGIYLAKSNNCIVRNNIVKGEAVKEYSSGNAIHAWYCDSLVIKNNMAVNHRDGIYLEFVNYTEISHNISTQNIRYGLHFMFSDNNTYYANTFKNNGTGVAVMYSSYIEMTNNKFIDNWGSASYGILFKELRDSRMERNEFSNNTIGLYAEGSNRIMMKENKFNNNGWAIKIMANCENDTIRRNNFIGNTFEISTNSSTNYNYYEKNYWSGYKGYDLDHDGFGDQPHNPVTLFNYLVETNPSTVVLLHSLFIDILNLAEKVTPVITPTSISDEKPLMKPVKW